MSNLDEMLDKVDSRESFLTFVKALIKDREDEVEKEKINPSSPYGAGANGWENGTIESYLEASVACAEGHKAGYILAESASWNSFAQFLYVGKIYE